MSSRPSARIAMLLALACGPAWLAAATTPETPAPASRAATQPAESNDLESRRVGSGLGPKDTAASLGDWLAIGAALALVAGVLAGVAWLVRRLTPRNGTGGKSPLLDVLAVKAISSKERLVLVRMGSRLVLVGSGPGGPRMLSEISDGEEVRQAQRQASGAGNWRADTSPDAQNGGRP